MADDKPPHYPTVPAGELAESFSYNVDVNLNSPALNDWYGSMRPKFFKNLFGNLYGEGDTLSKEQRERIVEVARELVGRDIEVEFVGNDNIAGDATKNRIRINDDLGISDAFPFMIEVFRPDIPSTLTQEMILLMVVIHEAEHGTQLFGREVDTDDRLVVVDLENDADYAVVKFLRDQEAELERRFRNGRFQVSVSGIDGDDIADTWLNYRAYSALFSSVISEEENGSSSTEHITSLSIRHYERTGEVLDREALVDAHNDLTKKIIDFIDRNELGINGDNDYEPNKPEQFVDQGVAIIVDAITELSQEAQDVLVEALQNEYGGATLENTIENMLDDGDNKFSDDTFEYVHASIYNPVLMLTALEDIVANEDLTEMESYMAANAIESLRDLGYDPIEGDLSQHVNFVIEAMDREATEEFESYRREVGQFMQNAVQTILESRAESENAPEDDEVAPDEQLETPEPVVGEQPETANFIPQGGGDSTLTIPRR